MVGDTLMPQVVMSKQAYERFFSFIIRHAHPSAPRNTWQEVIGFMFGRFGGDDDEEQSEVYVTDVLPMDSGSAVYVKVGDYSPIFPVLEEKMEQGEFIVGWIHSHPGLSVFMSGTDVNTQTLYQQMNDRAVAIVCDHTTIRPDYPGLKGFRVKGGGMDYHSVSVVVEGVPDFYELYQRLVEETESAYQFTQQTLSQANVVELDQIRLRLEGPTKWDKRDEPYQVLLRYETTQPGYVQVRYHPAVQGGVLSPLSRRILRHRPYESSVLAVFQAQARPKNDRWPTSVHLRLEGLTIVNVDGEELGAEEMSLVTQLGR